jgi:hypothetical protein
MKKISLIISLLVLFTSCKQTKTEKKSITPSQPVISFSPEETDSSSLPIRFLDIGLKWDIIDSIDITDFVDTIMAIKLETNDNFLIGRIDKACILNDRIVILDRKLSQTIFVFDLAGKFINKYSKRGKGPGEFVALNDLTVGNDSIFALIDNTTILCFDKELNLSKSVKLDCWAAYFEKDINTNGYVISGITPVGDVSFCSSNGKSIKHYLKNHNSDNIFSTYAYSVINNNILFYHPLLDTVYLVDQNHCKPVRYFNRDRSRGYFTYFETHHSIFFINNMRWLYKNKITNQEYWINFHSSSSKSLIFTHYFIQGVYKDFFISSIEPTHLLSENALKFNDDFITEMRKGVQIESNPIILLTKFK